jgi:DNA-binding GntR family transcriptional regulator
MRLDIQEGKQTPESLRDMLEKNLVEIYGFSRDTVRKARAEVLSEIVEKSNPDK